MTGVKKRCYICQGTRVIFVSEWEGDEETRTETICVRCKGSGYITDGFGTRDILELETEVPREYRPCICVFDRDGPLGHPHCPAR